MTKDEELQKAYEDLERSEKRVIRLSKELQDYNRIEEIIIAAGLLDKEKFDQAREIISNFK